MDFSERMGFTNVRTILQTHDMDRALRNSLFNVLFRIIEREFDLRGGRALFMRVWANRRKLPMDEFPAQKYRALAELKDVFGEHPAHQVYNLIEFIAQDSGILQVDPDFITNTNRVLEREMSAYRFVGNVLSPIISGPEIEEVERALATTDGFKPVAVHLGAALELLSNRTTPDYRNSIKESISAVEAACRAATGDTNATLGSAIKKLEDSGVSLHGAFKGALSQMYGYTSDADGIRHALLEESKVEQADAIFMLITCSAFVNYLKTKLAVRTR